MSSLHATDLGVQRRRGVKSWGQEVAISDRQLKISDTEDKGVEHFYFASKFPKWGTPNYAFLEEHFPSG